MTAGASALGGTPVEDNAAGDDSNSEEDVLSFDCSKSESAAFKASRRRSGLVAGLEEVGCEAPVTGLACFVVPGPFGAGGVEVGNGFFSVSSLIGIVLSGEEDGTILQTGLAKKLQTSTGATAIVAFFR